MQVVGKGAGPPRAAMTGGEVGLYALIRQGGVDHGFPLCVQPPAVPKYLLAIPTCHGSPC